MVWDLFGYTSGATIENVGLLNANITGQYGVGGLVGYNRYSSSIDNSYATGSVSGTANNVGGLVGYNISSNIDNSYATDSVNGNQAVGGLVGNTDSSSISNSYATGTIIGSGYNVGGLVGFNNLTSINNSYAIGNVSSSRGAVGGLIGLNYNSSSINNSYATGSVSGSTAVGGLAGYNQVNSSIDNSYATGSVSGSNWIGGLVGVNDYSGSITNSYAIGSVNGSSKVGGLVGWNAYSSTIDNSYATGNVSGSSNFGGLIGYDDGTNTLTNNWWYDSLSNGIGNYGPDTSSGHWQEAGSASDFYSSSQPVYSTWDFNGLWKGGAGVSYPTLIWQDMNNGSFIGGTASIPFLIHNVNQLQFMGYALNDSFQLDSDIEASATSGWNSGAGFMPVGNSSTPFTGTFNGDSYTISDLFIDLPSTNGVGLFGDTSCATIENVGLVNANITGQNGVGALVGYNNNSSRIDNSYATGTVQGGNYVGGLVGQNTNSSSIDNSYATDRVIGGSYSAGGLVGGNYNSSSIDNSYATGSVSGNYWVAGLVGTNYLSSIANSYATGTVSGGYWVAGGLVGGNTFGSVANSYATGNVSGTFNIGGLVGFNSSGNIINSYATGSLSGSNEVGGLVGYTYLSSIANSYATGSVSGGSYTGGLVGFDDSTNTLANNWWYSSLSKGIGNNASDTSVGQWQEAGGVSDFYSLSQPVYSTWDFNGLWKDGAGVAYPTLIWQDMNNGSFIGGTESIPFLVYNVNQLQFMEYAPSDSFQLALDIDASATFGWNAGAGFTPVGNSSTPFTGTFNGNNYTISDLFINLPTTNDVGLFGYTNDATIENVGLLNANITGQNNVGGLVGYNNSSSINNSYVTGGVNGGNFNVGGLVGYNNSSDIANSYVTGSVSGTY